MLNNISIMGRMTRDPELRKTGSGVSVASFSIACDRDIANKETGERETDFVDCVAWRGTADFVQRNFSKGAMIVVVGRIQTRSWNDKDGNKRRTTEVVADNVYFGEAKKASDGNSYTPKVQSTSQGYARPHSDFQQIDIPDAQLPF